MHVDAGRKYESSASLSIWDGKKMIMHRGRRNILINYSRSGLLDRSNLNNEVSWPLMAHRAAVARHRQDLNPPAAYQGQPFTVTYPRLQRIVKNDKKSLTSQMGNFLVSPVPKCYVNNASLLDQVHFLFTVVVSE